ncbi:MAG: hypothetical protein V1781_09000 [Bacteroidota bacterium]
MARIISPGTAAGWKKLHDGIKTKHDADGTNSVLMIFLNEGKINLAADNKFLLESVDRHDKRKIAGDKAEELRKDRNNFFKPAIFIFKKGAQFLKAFYKNNVRKLGDWGLTIDNKNRIVYPTNFDSLFKLFVIFYNKHKSFLGKDSPLYNFLIENNIDLETLNKDVVQANKINTDFSKENKRMEEEQKNSDNLMEQPIKNTRAICQFLIKHFSNNPKKLGQYGITVDDSPRGSVRRTITINPSQQKTVRGALIGGLFINTGITILELRAGKKGDGEKKSIAPNKEFIIQKKFSIFIVINTNTDTKGSYSVDINR